MITRRELVNRCLALYDFLEPTDSLIDDEDALKGLFADLRREPETLAGLLAGVPDAEEIQRRFAWLTDGLPPRDASLYAIPSGASSINPDETESLVRAHYDSIGALLREAGYSDEADDVQGRRSIELRPPTRTEGLDDYFDEYSDYLADRIDETHPAASLHEAGYGFAAVYEVTWYLLWCVLRQSVSVQDPFRPAATLWKRGIRWIRTPSAILVWSSGYEPTSSSD